MIQIKIHRRELHFNKQEQEIARAARERRALELPFQGILRKKSMAATSSTFTVNETTVNRMIVKYSEQLTFQPLAEIRYWFAYTGGLFLEPGYPPLFYTRTSHKTVSPNKSAVAAVGEGIAGLLAQRLYHCRLLARPNHDYPDVVMNADDTTYLFESKATLSDNTIEHTLQDETPRLLNYVAACNGLDKRPVIGVLVGTTIQSETDYECCVWEIHV